LSSFFRKSCTISTPIPATPIPANSFSVKLSPKNSTANIGIWIIIVLLMMLDSIAGNDLNVRFQRVKAKAVLINASQMMMSQLFKSRTGIP